MPELAAAIAAVAHEANREWCQQFGDDSQPEWEDAPEWQRESAIKGVSAIAKGEVTHPAQSHESWMAEKEEAGWTYGVRKDPERKEHPCLVPYHQLPQEQRAKDYLFFYLVTGLLTVYGAIPERKP